VPEVDQVEAAVGEDDPPSGGAVALRVDDGAFTDLGGVTHPTGTIRRSLVIGDTLWTVSDGGLAADQVHTGGGAAALTRLAWVPFA